MKAEKIFTTPSWGCVQDDANIGIGIECCRRGNGTLVVFDFACTRLSTSIHSFFTCCFCSFTKLRLRLSLNGKKLFRVMLFRFEPLSLCLVGPSFFISREKSFHFPKPKTELMPPRLSLIRPPQTKVVCIEQARRDSRANGFVFAYHIQRPEPTRTLDTLTDALPNNEVLRSVFSESPIWGSLYKFTRMRRLQSLHPR